MKSLLLKFVLLLFLFSSDVVSQTLPWFTFREETEEETSLFGSKAGFKDSKGNILFPPTFGLISANRVDHIVAVSEQIENSLVCYYLLKDQRIVGRDSTYFMDMTFDCESEGFIRFTDPKTEKNGLFNRKGEVVIPADYALTPVRNGLIMALKDPVKEYWDDHQESGCNHWSWKGSMEVLMDTTGMILIENFDTRKKLDLYSLVISEQPSEESYRVNYTGTNGKYYSFIDLEKYFHEIFLPAFLKDLSQESLLAYTHSHAFYYMDPVNNWKIVSGMEFIEHYYMELRIRLEEFRDGFPDHSDHFISNDFLGWVPLQWKEMYPEYFDNCGNLHPRYPKIYIRYTHDNDKQDQYSFMRTPNGFKLISVTLR